MARTPSSKTRAADPEPTIDASSLPSAEPHELETFAEPTSALKVAFDLANAAADAVKDEPAPQREPEGPPMQEVAAQAAARDTFEPVQRVPGWAKVPEGGFRFPKHRQVTFIRLRAEWTDTPTLGDRILILWNLSPGDEAFALKRAQGDVNRITDEMVKQCIRAIDGQVVDWGAMNQSNPDVLWGQVGRKCRQLLLKMYLRINTLGASEVRDFLETCVAVVTVG